MLDRDAILSRARANPAALRFVELCWLAERYGWQLARIRGSHHIYKKVGEMRLMSFQDDRGSAKAYQVRQLLAAIEAEPPTTE